MEDPIVKDQLVTVLRQLAELTPRIVALEAAIVDLKKDLEYAHGDLNEARDTAQIAAAYAERRRRELANDFDDYRRQAEYDRTQAADRIAQLERESRY